MQYTNKNGLPQVFENAIRSKNAAYDRGPVDRSVSQLINSPRIDRLNARYKDDVVRDISDELWSLFGTALHDLLENNAEDNVVTEERLFAELDGMSFSGAIDRQVIKPGNRIAIHDFKLTTVFSVTKDEEVKPDWVKQLNLYRFLVEYNKGCEVDELAIFAVIRDWSSSRAESDILYPRAPISRIDIPLWSHDELMSYLRERIRLHQEAEILDRAGLELPYCTSEECWEMATKWAVKKPQNKRAYRVCDSEEEALEVAQEAGPEYEIDIRPGKRNRCEGNWCNVADRCNQWQEFLEING